MRIEHETLIELEDGDINHGRCDIPEGVRFIGDDVFFERKDLVLVTLPQSLEVIGEKAFCFCDQLDSLILPQSLETIGSAAFYGCVKLKAVTLPPRGVRAIESIVFYYCRNLTSLTFSLDLETIGEGALEGCSGLTCLYFPAGMRSIEKRAMYECVNLCEVTLPEGVECIGEWVFESCRKLEHIFVYSNNAEEVQRIRALLPNEHHNKCEAHPLYEAIERARKQALYRLCGEVKTSKRYSYAHQGVFSKLPEDMISEISRMSGRESGYYRKAEDDMLCVALPRSDVEGDLAAYQARMNTIADMYMDMARAHKTYPYKRNQAQGNDTEETKGDDNPYVPGNT